MKFIRLISVFLSISALVLILLQLVVSTELAGAGKNTLSLDKAIVLLQSENELMRQQLASQTSLIAIEVKAKGFGFGYFASTVTLDPPDVAYNRTQ